MKIRPQQIVKKTFHTNGVLRCISGVDIEKHDVEDVLSTAKTVFCYSDSDLESIINSRNPFGVVLMLIGAGKHLELKNPQLKAFKERILKFKQLEDVNTEIRKIVSEIGENINLEV